MLVPSSTNILENIVFISRNLVVLQTLRAGYLTEKECTNEQRIKNFRTDAILDLVRDLLDDLDPYMEFLVLCEEGSIPMHPQQIPHIVAMIKDLTEFYDWTIEEVKLKNYRSNLMELESQWKAELD